MVRASEDGNPLRPKPPPVPFPPPQLAPPGLPSPHTRSPSLRRGVTRSPFLLPGGYPVPSEGRGAPGGARRGGERHAGHRQVPDPGAWACWAAAGAARRGHRHRPGVAWIVFGHAAGNPPEAGRRPGSPRAGGRSEGLPVRRPGPGPPRAPRDTARAGAPGGMRRSAVGQEGGAGLGRAARPPPCSAPASGWPRRPSGPGQAFGRRGTFREGGVGSEGQGVGEGGGD